MRSLLYILVIISFLFTPRAKAGDFSQEPYLMRVALTLTRASNYADTAGRQASVAYPRGSSVNPAADDCTGDRVTDDNHATLTTLNSLSDSGAWIAALAGTTSISLADKGTWSLAYARTETPEKNNTDDLDNILRSNEFFMGYSKKLSDRICIGAQGRLTDAFFREESMQPGLGFQPVRADTDQFGIDVTAGVLFFLRQHYTLGLMATAGWWDTDTTVSNMTPLRTPLFLLQPGSTLEVVDDTAKLQSVQAGMGYSPNDWFGVYLDLQYVQVETNTVGSVDIQRVALGIETKPNHLISLRAGTTLDSENELTISAGLRVYVFEKIPIDIAYQYNNAPEVKKEFGTINSINASLAIPF